MTTAAAASVLSMRDLCEITGLSHWTMRRQMDRCVKLGLLPDRGRIGGWTRILLVEDLPALRSALKNFGYLGVEEL